MAQNVLVDLDLNQNQILDLADGLLPTDATNKGQVDAGDAAVTAAFQAADLVLQGAIDTLDSNVITGVAAGNGLTGGGSTGDVTVSALADPAAGNALTVSATGLFVPTPVAQDISGKADITYVDSENAAQDLVIATKADQADLDAEEAARIAGDAANATATSDVATDLAQEIIDRTSGDAALDAAIKGISLVGSGTVTVTESAVDSNQWTIEVPAVQLANTYTGPGSDPASIDADLVTQGVTAQAGDLYINDTTGTAYLNTGLASPGNWTPLQAGSAGITSITGIDGSVAVTNGGGPVTNVAVSAALQSAISTSTATNTAQDGRLTAVEAANAAQDTAIAGKAEKLTMINAGQGLGGGGNLSGNVTIDVNAGVGLGVDASGLWVDAGTAIDVTDGVSVKYGTGIALVADGDTLGVDTTWLSGQIAAGSSNVTAGDGIDVTADVISAVQDPALDNILVVSGTGLYVPPPGAVTIPVTDVVGTAPIIVTDDAGVYTVSLDATVPTTIQDAIDAGDATVSAEVDAEEAARIAADALKADKATTVTAGLGISGGGTLAGPDIPVSAKIDPTVGNQLTVGPAGLLVSPAAAIDFPVDDVNGTVGQITVTEAPVGTFAVGIDPVYTTARDAYADAAVLVETNARTAADAALQGEVDTVEAGLATEITNRTTADTAINTRIDGITITGTGAASVTEPTPDQFVVHVETLALANTYTGITGVDADSINTEIAPAVAQPGDLYVNTVSGIAFISTGGDPAGWVELATPTAALTSIASTDASITVQNGTGPAVDVAVSTALQTAISTATTTNTAQDTAILALQGADTALAADITALEAADVALAADITAVEGVNTTQDGRLSALETNDATQDTDIAALQATSHVAATGAAAIAVNGAGQVVSLTIDPSSAGILSQSATGLAISLPPAGIQKVTGTVTVTGGIGSFVHGLGNSAVVVSVKSGGCHVTAAVCDTVADPTNSVDIEAADGDYTVTVIG